MHEINLAQLDLNLLKVFQALIEEGSVTAASERLGQAQSTVSHSLARLREAINDPLFVRSTHGLQPTPLAAAIRDPVTRALQMLQEAFDQHQIFQPATSTRTFNLLLSDVGEMLHIPPLMSKIRAEAPGVRVVTHHMPRQHYKEALGDGTMDLAIGQLPQGQTDLVQQFLSTEPFEGYARAGHPILKKPTLEAFLAADHVIVGRPAVSESHTVRALGPLAAKRRVVLELRHYLPAAFVLSQTDLVAVMPCTLREFHGSFKSLARFEPPFKIEPVTLRQFWHGRSTNDDGCKWLRSLVASLFQRRSA